MAKRIIENRVSVTLPLARKRKLEAIAGRPGELKTPGAIAGALLDAAWPMFEAMRLDPRAVHSYVEQHFGAAKREPRVS